MLQFVFVKVIWLLELQSLSPISVLPGYRERDLAMRGSPCHSEPDRRYVDDRSRDHSRPGDHRERLHRSRSRSPIRNGPDSLQKVDGYVHPLERSEIKIKEERKEDVMAVDDHDRKLALDSQERRLSMDPYDHRQSSSAGTPQDKADIRNDVLPPPGLGYPPSIDRRPLGLPYPGLDRGGAPMWNLLERSPLDLDQREQLRRMSLSGIDPERLRGEQELMLRRMEHERKSYLAAVSTAAGELDRAKIPPPLRPSEPFYLGGPPPSSIYGGGPPGPHSAGASPALSNHTSTSSKNSSPNPMMGVPPPLIPSATSLSHSNSPTAAKTKPPSPLRNSPLHVQPTKAKMELVGTPNGHDIEAQSR